MTITLSHGGPTVFSSDSRSDEVLVGTARGITTLARVEGGWQVAQTSLADMHISAILHEPESGLLFAGAYDDGSLRASKDGGRTWERRDHGLSETNIYSLESQSVGGHVRLFVGTEPAKLFVSDDLGIHWTERPGLRRVPTVNTWTFPAPPHVAHAKQITFDPRVASTMYVSIEQGGLLRSTDAGETWADVPGMYEDVHRLVINPSDPKRMYITGGAGLYVSEDAGVTWEHRTAHGDEIGGYPDQLVFDPRKPELMFISAAQDNPGTWRASGFAGARISRSRNGGRSWEVLRSGLPDRMQGNVEAMSLEASGVDCSIFAATTAGEVFASEDSGQTWSVIAAGLAPISKAGHYRALVPASV